MARKIPKMYRDIELEKQYEEARIEKIYQEVKLRSRIRAVNKRISELKKAGYYEESLAVENILNYLGSMPIGVGKTKKGFVSLKNVTGRNETVTSGIKQAIDQFFKNKTSSVAGFEELYEERRDQLFKMFDDKDFVESLSMADLKTIYSVFQSNEYKKNSRKFDSKTFYIMYTKAIDRKISKHTFIKEFEWYLGDGADDDLKDDLKKIYDNYIKGYVNR